MTATFIISNGSKWLGENPDSIDTLIDRLTNEVLDPTFEEYGDFCERAGDETVESLNAGGRCPSHQEAVRIGDSIAGPALHFWGNFYSYSHVFSVVTDDPDLIARMTTAIRANKATVAYKEARDARKDQRRQRLEQEAERQRQQDRDNRRRGR